MKFSSKVKIERAKKLMISYSKKAKPKLNYNEIDLLEKILNSKSIIHDGVKSFDKIRESRCSFISQYAALNSAINDNNRFEDVEFYSDELKIEFKKLIKTPD